MRNCKRCNKLLKKRELILCERCKFDEFNLVKYKYNSLGNKPLCIKDVNENIRRVEVGMPLTKPLKELNLVCEFKKKFIEMDKIRHPVFKCLGCRNEINKKGYCSEECKIKYHKKQKIWELNRKRKQEELKKRNKTKVIKVYLGETEYKEK